MFKCPLRGLTPGYLIGGCTDTVSVIYDGALLPEFPQRLAPLVVMAAVAIAIVFERKLKIPIQGKRS